MYDISVLHLKFQTSRFCSAFHHCQQVFKDYQTFCVVMNIMIFLLVVEFTFSFLFIYWLQGVDNIFWLNSTKMQLSLNSTWGTNQTERIKFHIGTTICYWKANRFLIYQTICKKLNQTFPEAQRTQAIEYKTRVFSAAKKNTNSIWSKR